MRHKGAGRNTSSASTLAKTSGRESPAISIERWTSDRGWLAALGTKMAVCQESTAAREEKQPRVPAWWVPDQAG